jgi:hypothetical protein
MAVELGFCPPRSPRGGDARGAEGFPIGTTISPLTTRLSTLGPTDVKA